jgi:hypothetical protein
MTAAARQRPKSNGNLPTVYVPATLTAPALDRGLASVSPESKHLLFDLGDIRFADPTTLLYLTAVLSSLSRRGTSISIELPRSKRVRDLMRRYRFGQALQRLVESPALELLTESSATYTTEPALHYLGRPRIAGDARAEERAQQRLAAISVTPRPTPDAAVTGMREWMDDDVAALLKQHLGDSADLIGPGIVFEALANAVEHPQASNLVTNGFFDERARKGKGLLTIAVWDDGESIVSTLRTALRKKRKLRSPRAKIALEPYNAWYAIFEGESPAASKTLKKKVFSDDFTPTEDSPDPDLLFAAALPGVTCDPARKFSVAATKLKKPNFDRPGMGLYILTSLAIDSFVGGEVLLRTGAVSANFRRAPLKVQKYEQCHYRVGIVHQPKMSQYLSGNLLVVRLPLNY